MTDKPTAREYLQVMCDKLIDCGLDARITNKTTLYIDNMKGLRHDVDLGEFAYACPVDATQNEQVRLWGVVPSRNFFGKLGYQEQHYHLDPIIYNPKAK